MDENTTAATYKTEQTSKKKPILLTLLAICLVLLGCVGTYYWQHRQLVSVDHKLNTSDTQKEALQRKNSSLQKQYDQARATIENYQAKAKAANSPLAAVIATQADLDLSLLGAQYVNPAGTVTEGGKWFGVNMTLTNNTHQTVSISDADFQLKDAQNNTYPEETIQGATTLPDGWTSMPNKTIAPGETIRGSVTFQMPNTTIKNFTFINVTKPYSVTSAN